MLCENKMKKEIWTKLVDITTIVWISVFLLGFVIKDAIIKQVCNQFNFFLLPVFILDLYYLYKKTGKIKKFLKEKWLDILLVIPYFRIFRILRFTKVLRLIKIFKFTKARKTMILVKKSNRAINLASNKNT